MYETITSSSFQCMVDLPVQLKCKSQIFGNQVVLFNFEHGMCALGEMVSYDGGITTFFQSHNVFAIREGRQGLQYFDSNCWRFFDDAVQEEYAGYKLENEIK